MTTGTAFLLVSSAAATAAGIVVSAVLVGRARRAMPGDVEGRTAALLRLHKARVRTSAGVFFVPMMVALFAQDPAAYGLLAPVLLASCLVWELASVGRVFRLQSEIRGPRWSPRVVCILHRSQVMRAIGVPLCASLGVMAVHAIAPAHDPGGWAFNGHGLGVLVGLLVTAWGARRLGRAEPIAEAHVAPLRAKFGDRLPALQLFRTGGEGMWNALAFGVLPRRTRILVSEDLAELLTTDELHAVLCHEIGHHRLHHIHFRVLLLLTALVVPAAAAAALGVLSPNVSAFSILVCLLPAGRLYRRQEREADAFAAQHAPAADLGAALEKMTRAQLLPTAERHGGTHPALHERLVALGLPLTVAAGTKG